MQFILNDKEINTTLPPGTLLLDFVRYHRHLVGTKIGCREGDCGACTVLIGELAEGKMKYRSATSCLTALGNVNGRHVVTVEGTNHAATLNPVQQAMCDEAATQCGFCTPGFVVSLAGFCLDERQPSLAHAIASIDGNICRCTGYKSIGRAAAQVAKMMEERNGQDPVGFATEKQLLPGYFTGIAERLKVLRERREQINPPGPKILGGGTDLYVQQHETMHAEDIHFVSDDKKYPTVFQEGDRCVLDGAATITDLLESALLREYFPSLASFTKLVSSTPIRNIATIAGNFINASPIGDFTIFFLALDARIVLGKGDTVRELPLRELYRGYKLLNREAGEVILRTWFELPRPNSFFNFEKVSKRTHLDIASVNTALHIKMEGKVITGAGLSAGGVGPVPMLLSATSAFLEGKVVNAELVGQALEICQSEISPITDTRGTAAYKKLLLRQLVKAHFTRFFPSLAASILHL